MGTLLQMIGSYDPAMFRARQQQAQAEVANTQAEANLRRQMVADNELKAKLQQRAMQDEEVMRQVLLSGAKDPVKAAIVAGMSGSGVVKFGTLINQQKKAALALQGEEFKREAEQHKRVGEVLGAVMSVKNPEDRLTAIRSANVALQPYNVQIPEHASPTQLDILMGLHGHLGTYLDQSKKRMDEETAAFDLEQKRKLAPFQENKAAAEATSAILKASGQEPTQPAEQARINALANPKPVAGRDVPLPPDVEAQRTRMAAANSAASAANTPIEPLGPGDPAANEILGQTGLSIPAFSVLTGQMGSLPRSGALRSAAMKEAQEFARKRGVDISTLASQYKTYNTVLSGNISRLNNTKIMENELQGTIENLQGVVNQADLGKLKFANVARVWAGQEVNDPLAQQYAMHLSQLRNELTAYYAATQGRTGNNITLEDKREAEGVIKNGVSTGSLQGLSAAVKSSTDKMGTIMQRSVDNAGKAVWDLFGVGKNYKPKAGGGEEKPKQRQKWALDANGNPVRVQ